MATPFDKLAHSLDFLYKLQKKDNCAVFQGKEVSRLHKARLVKNGYLYKVIKCWYISIPLTQIAEPNTIWFASYWNFFSTYLTKRFGNNWSLSPEQSLILHTENWTVPRQLLVRSPKGNNKITKLPFDTSLLDVRYPLPKKNNFDEKNGLRIFKISSALIAANQKFFTQYPNEARAALLMIKHASQLLPELVEGGHSTIAGRLIGGLRNVGSHAIADEIYQSMQFFGL